MTPGPRGHPAPPHPALPAPTSAPSHPPLGAGDTAPLAPPAPPAPRCRPGALTGIVERLVQPQQRPVPGAAQAVGAGGPLQHVLHVELQQIGGGLGADAPQQEPRRVPGGGRAHPQLRALQPVGGPGQDALGVWGGRETPGAGGWGQRPLPTPCTAPTAGCWCGSPVLPVWNWALTAQPRAPSLDQGPLHPKPMLPVWTSPPTLLCPQCSQFGTRPSVPSPALPVWTSPPPCSAPSAPSLHRGSFTPHPSAPSLDQDFLVSQTSAPSLHRGPFTPHLSTPSLDLDPFRPHPSTPSLHQRPQQQRGRPPLTLGVLEGEDEERPQALAAPHGAPPRAPPALEVEDEEILVGVGGGAPHLQHPLGHPAPPSLGGALSTPTPPPHGSTAPRDPNPEPPPQPPGTPLHPPNPPAPPAPPPLPVPPAPLRARNRNRNRTGGGGRG